MNPLDRKLAVLAFRRVCPWNALIIRFVAGISQAVWSLSADTGFGDKSQSVGNLRLCRTLPRATREAVVKCFLFLVKPPSLSRPRFLARARRLARHDARRELRNDVHLGGVGQAERAHPGFWSVGQAAALTAA